MGCYSRIGYPYGVNITELLAHGSVLIRTPLAYVNCHLNNPIEMSTTSWSGSCLGASSLMCTF